jgi:uncharacterized protein (TIGR00255 family)
VIQSMTGYGRAGFAVEAQRFQVEVRSVNHRHLDIQARLPRLLSPLEPDLRRRVQDRVQRGKVDVVVSLPVSGARPGELHIDREVAAAYLAAARALGDEHGIDGELPAARLLMLPGVARSVERELPEDALAPAVGAALEEALAELLAMRRSEGAALERELRERLQKVTALLEEVEARSDSVQNAVRERLRKRTAQLQQETGLLDEARLHQEVVLAADRLDVTEEIVRLRSHIEQFGAALSSAEGSGPLGRRLEFLLQEMVRETNTIGSKASDAPVAHHVVELKTQLERMREQVLNVE